MISPLSSMSHVQPAAVRPAHARQENRVTAMAQPQFGCMEHAQQVAEHGQHIVMALAAALPVAGFLLRNKIKALFNKTAQKPPVENTQKPQDPKKGE